MKRKSFGFASSLCLFLLPLCLIAQTQPPTATHEIIQNEADLIHFGDLIDVDFAGTLEYDWRGTLRSDGTLEGLDQFGPVRGSCRSESDVAAEIARRYSKILRDPRVSVRIVDRSDRAVARLDGAIKVPMRFRILRIVHLRELIVAAGGLTDEASGQIIILRPAGLSCGPELNDTEIMANPDKKSSPDNGLQIINISINDLLSGKELADPIVLSGDTVTVTKSVPIYVIGAVNNPRPIFSHTGMTLGRAIATAGGLTKNGEGQKISIFRRSGNETNIIQADLERIKNGEISDVELQAFDIIEVAFKGRAKRKYPPVITVGDNRERNASDLPLKVID